MKIIIAGASGFVGKELIRQCLRMPTITSVVALSRRGVSPPDNSEGVSKLRNVKVSDYDNYPDDVRKEFDGANACIWYVLF
jgi:nucleoside-diphosphate-sugar epimerase